MSRENRLELESSTRTSTQEISMTYQRALTAAPALCAAFATAAAAHADTHYSPKVAEASYSSGKISVTYYPTYGDLQVKLTAKVKQSSKTVLITLDTYSTSGTVSKTAGKRTTKSVSVSGLTNGLTYAL